MRRELHPKVCAGIFGLQGGVLGDKAF
jgi:hypothetical protein